MRIGGEPHMHTAHSTCLKLNIAMRNAKIPFVKGTIRVMLRLVPARAAAGGGTTDYLAHPSQGAP